jgi:hypothetical protein
MHANLVYGCVYRRRRLLAEDAAVLTGGAWGPNKADDLVFPGDSYVYKWTVGFESCLVYTYMYTVCARAHTHLELGRVYISTQGCGTWTCICRRFFIIDAHLFKRLAHAYIHTHTHTHVQVPESAGPGPNDPSSVAWTYQSMADGEFDLFTGLIGVVIVTRKGMTAANGMPKDVDNEVVSFFVNFNENESHLRDQNMQDLTPKCDEKCHFEDEVS